jgi:endoglucanase
MHQYLDSDSSGTSADCTSETIGAERVAAATAWLKQNNLRGVLGEFGGGSNGLFNPAFKTGNILTTISQMFALVPSKVC